MHNNKLRSKYKTSASIWLLYFLATFQDSPNKIYKIGQTTENTTDGGLIFTFSPDVDSTLQINNEVTVPNINGNKSINKYKIIFK